MARGAIPKRTISVPLRSSTSAGLSSNVSAWTLAPFHSQTVGEASRPPSAAKAAGRPISAPTPRQTRSSPSRLLQLTQPGPRVAISITAQGIRSGQGTITMSPAWTTSMISSPLSSTSRAAVVPKVLAIRWGESPARTT